MPKIVDHEERRAHIVEAVTQIIVRDGFDRVTMREIAREAGYAHGAIARYFPDKQSLLTAAFLHVFSSSQEYSEQQVSGVRGLEGLRRMSRVILPFSAVGSQKSRLVLSFWDRASQDPELWEIHHEVIVRRRDLIRRLLLEAEEDGELRADIDIEVALEEVAARNAGWQMLAVLVPEAATDEKIEGSLTAMLDSFRPPHSRSLA